ncbi:diguanylate cyclase (GGDEF)-like protein/PAS domain S-box-containing protein [Gracilibacillus halotolerans]|uniref:Diguanylate cyclase (GGDEF)-like protein/PAS domain S-box-containing protein n=1 Tax=Gracilibacillus halotolerans TaxID=74386 RepID=A0A841RLK1_9BACI|nr:diguanylate cyclase [Gracilibacillus halotolerans]MBB6512336.1 diguanylate cyclase (GGDEF)-like protein/PAS domain S-box-containing protein [Gracilibacillus halotolerans]
MWIVLVMMMIVLLLVCAMLFLRITQLQKEVDIYNPLVEAGKNIRDIVYYCETVPKLKYRYLSPSVNNVIGPNTLEEHLKNPELIYDIVHPDDIEILKKKQLGELNFNEPIRVRYRNHLGEYVWFEEYATPLYKNGKYVAVQGVFRNIDEVVTLQQQLEYKSTHDSLTGLFNRYYFHSKMDDYNKQDISIAVIVGDLDELKAINDKYGHQLGDQLISEAAKCLNICSEQEVTVARLGGDEFAILLPEVTVSEVEQYIRDLERNLLQVDGELSFSSIQMSLGYEFSDSSFGVMEKLFNKADANMYRNKRKKKSLSEV